MKIPTQYQLIMPYTTIIGNVAMQVAPPGGQTCDLSKYRHPVAKIETNPNGITCWPNLEAMQEAFFLAGEIAQVIESIPWVRCASGNVFWTN